jgi:hypothetical protein
MALTYFAADGNYGDASGMVFIDTSEWTEEEWAVIEEAHDIERPRIAIELEVDNEPESE